MSDSGETVAIIGGGISGLATHHFLQQQGVESTVFEAAPNPGGVIQTTLEAGRILDHGPQRTRRTPIVQTLIDSIDLNERIIEATDRPLYMYHDETLRRVPTSIASALTTDLLSVRGKLRILAEPLREVEPRPGESVLDYFIRTMGQEFAERIGGPLYAGLYASDPTEMPVEHSLARALDRVGVEGSLVAYAIRKTMRRQSPPQMISFDDGMAVLVNRLATTYRDCIRLETPVRELTAVDPGYRVRTADGTQTIDHVVLATQAPTVGQLLSGVDDRLAKQFTALTYNPIIVVHLQAERTLHGAGFQVSWGNSSVIRGATWNCSLFPGASLGRDGIYTVYLDADRVNMTDSKEAIGNRAARAFEAITELPVAPLDVTIVRPGMPAYDRSWDGLLDQDTKSGLHLCTSALDRAGISGRLAHARSVASKVAANLE